MSTADDLPPPTTPDNMKPLARPVLLERLTIRVCSWPSCIWRGTCSLSHCMTFMFSCVALAVVGWAMRNLSSDLGRPRLLTLATSVFGPAILARPIPSHAGIREDRYGSRRDPRPVTRGQTGELQSRGLVHFSDNRQRIHRTSVGRKHGPDPFVLDFAVLLRGRWNCCDLILFELY